MGSTANGSMRFEVYVMLVPHIVFQAIGVFQPSILFQ